MRVTILRACLGWLLAISLHAAGTGSYEIASVGDIYAELGRQLSHEANIYFPGTSEFHEATDRWSLYHPPNFIVVVEVAVEEDVAKTVKYANSHDIPFLAVNGGHGTISSLSNLHHGIEIWIHKLDSFEISEDGETATFGGGITSFNLMESLWAEGKQTVHGVCECTSYLGPGLGGGHGALQGRYGLISDQFVSMRVVTADGTIRSISSDGPGKDLWWVMQGAGHNFGIVTSITSKIYDVPHDGLWAYENHVFTHEHIEELFERFNRLAEIQPPGFMVWTSLIRDRQVDEENPVFSATFLQEGVPAIESKYIDPFRELSRGAVEKSSGLYTDIPRWIDSENNGTACSREGTKLRFPISFSRYNIEAQRELFETFAQGTAGISPLNDSMILLEQYSVQGIQAIPADSTAFPHRQDALLLSPVITYPSTAGPDTEIQAWELGESLRKILLRGTGTDELHAYVNYAIGDEAPESWYGYEPWRIERLRALKRKYDPRGKFRYYAPIPDVRGIE